MNHRSTQLNNRIFDNQVKHSSMSIVNRLNDFEKMFKSEMHMKNTPKRNYINDKKSHYNIGEITGDEFKSLDIDQGMPLRSNYTTKKNDDNDLEEALNKRMDFNIFDKEEEANEINYYDPLNDSVYNFDNMEKEDIKRTSITDINSKIMNDYSFFINENCRGLMTSSVAIMGHSIVNLLESLYIASKNNTSLELKNYLNLNDKTSIYEGNIKINEYLKKSECYEYRNIILIDKNIPVNGRFIEHISPLVSCYTINKTNPEQECGKINNYINSLFGNVYNNIIKKDHILNLSISCISVGLLRTVWKEPFQKVTRGAFMGPKNNVVVPMMMSQNKVFPYYEDTNNQIVELELFDNSLVMGIILPKNNNRKLSAILYEDCESYIENLKPTKLLEIIIPEFRINSKMRISNILMKTGLQNIFNNAEIPELIGKPGKISDFIQNMIIIVENKSVSNGISNTKNEQSGSSKFIANRPFHYYFRMPANNSIVITGLYYGT